MSGRPGKDLGSPKGGQPRAQASATTVSRLKPVVATLVGIPAAAIVLAAVNGTSVPLVGDGTAAVGGPPGRGWCGRGPGAPARPSERPSAAAGAEPADGFRTRLGRRLPLITSVR